MARQQVLTEEMLAQAARDYLEDNGYASAIEVAEDMMERSLTDESVEALDGCIVEDDGTCPHGYPSWLVYAGLM